MVLRTAAPTAGCTGLWRSIPNTAPRGPPHSRIATGRHPPPPPSPWSHAPPEAAAGVPTCWPSSPAGRGRGGWRSIAAKEGGGGGGWDDPCGCGHQCGWPLTCSRRAFSASMRSLAAAAMAACLALHSGTTRGADVSMCARAAASARARRASSSCRSSFSSAGLLAVGRGVKRRDIPAHCSAEGGGGVWWAHGGRVHKADEGGEAAASGTSTADDTFTTPPPPPQPGATSQCEGALRVDAARRAHKSTGSQTTRSQATSPAHPVM
jgi:hypothetical protein